jgi:peptidoglycan/LPS O-acetylase OafA/YrhL
MIGFLSVQAFFVLSGYLMTHVMHRSYDYTPSGFGRFWSNRILRLYPMYWIVIGLSALLVVFVGEDVSRTFMGDIFLPRTAQEWLQNLTFLFVNPFPSYETPRLAESTWALTVEMLYYFLISLGLSRWRWLTWLWVAAGFSWFIFIIATQKPFDWGYHHVAAGALPFSLGALAWHYRDTIDRSMARISRPANTTAGLMIAFGLAGLLGAGATGAVMSYLNWPDQAFIALLVLHTLIAFVLVNGAVRFKMPERFARADKWAGDLSYPMYISHYGFAIAAAQITQLAVPARSLHSAANLIVTLMLMLPVCWLLIRLIDHPIERLRDRVRGQQIQT